MVAVRGKSANCKAAVTEQQPKTNPCISRDRLLGYCFVHTVVDDHSWTAYAENYDYETAATAAGVLRSAVQWFTSRGVVVKRVLGDNGARYRSKLWQHTCAELGVIPKKTRIYRL